ncbi:metal-dependent hydrolase [Salibacterium aidingense]|uniref:metal-dependent hydrolase n=1 Tax=Salibacterium aidingense TaxID=384933 RepID=UPI0004796693|nr:metal-dependent hydrolase [Salibacterium aidingense]
MKVTYHGHSVVHIEANGKSILIDPFITGNDKCDLEADKVKPDIILLTHGHNDHVGDTVDIAKRNRSFVVAPFELATYLGWQGLDTHPMHIGGSYTFDFGRVKLTQAFHGSSYTEEENQKIVYTGMPAGILFEAEGKTVYHMGDTGLFSDMKLIGERHQVDLLFVPIGDNFTMGPEDAGQAVQWINPDYVVPVHYNTFPAIEQDGDAFVDSISPVNGKALNAGESVDL